MLNKIFDFILLAIFVIFIVLFGSLFATKAAGAPSDYRLLDAKDLNLEVYQIADSRDGYTPKEFDSPDSREHWTRGVAVNFNLDVLTYKGNGLYWDNKVHTEGTNYQVRRVGWQFEAGLHMGSKIDVFYQHHSQHIMEGQSETDKFPLTNFYGVRIHFLRGYK